MTDALGDPALVALLGDGVVSMGQYDALAILPISQVAARLCGKTHLQLVRDNARWLAERDINGIYKLLLKVFSPETVAKRLPKAAMQYFAFGEASASRQGEKRVEALQRGIPEPMWAWMAAAVEGFSGVALDLAGGKRPTIRVVSHERDGELGGVPTVTIQYLLGWS